MRALLCAVVLAAVGCGKITPPSVGSSPVAEKKTWTRDEFRKAIVGKSQEQVLKIAGTPTLTNDVAGEITFVYDGITVDPITGKQDRLVLVFFDNGVVTKVNF